MRIDFWTVALIVLLLGGGGYWMYRNNEKKKEAARIAYQMHLEQEKQAQEEKEKKKSNLKLLQDFVAREEKNLQKIIEEHKIWLQGLEEDKGQLSEALIAVEKKAKEADERSRKREQKRYSNAERVLLILNDTDINDLAKKYLGEDFTALRAEYQDKVNTILRMHKEQSRRLKANRDKYYKSVAGISEEVEKKNEAAGREIRESYASVKKTLDRLEGKRSRINQEIDGLTRGLQGSLTRKKLAQLRSQLDDLEKDIDTARQRYSLAKSQVAHLDATVAESSARRKFDTAIETRQTEDNDVHKDMQHESNVFNTANLYEKISLDKIRNALQTRSDILTKAINDAESKLDFMRSTSANMDFLNSKDLEKVREKIAKKLSEGVDVNMSNK